MDQLVILFLTLGSLVMHRPGLLLPKPLPASLVSNWRVTAQETEHPWERRLRQVEIDNTRSKAFAEQATKEAKDIIKDRTERLVMLEQWRREQERHADEGPVKVDKAVEKSEEATVKADKAVDAAAEVKATVREVFWTAVGGSAGLTLLISGAVAWAVRRLRKEFEEDRDAPVGAEPPSPSGESGGLFDLRSV